ncbi:LysR family transcriptional regulator, partial [Bacillus sp. SIMBA_026]|uniref:LysR family transcriptional regulator n=1 Tax=Bacillus sp. SIMBA_026 TaxID=3085769 RepID=UPI00397BC65B
MRGRSGERRRIPIGRARCAARAEVCPLWRCCPIIADIALLRSCHTVNLRRLKYFVKIVDIGSLTQAAEVLHIAQPALSQQLITL